jgi:hypothetical protein
MAQPVNPPDGWIVTSGVWGTDYQRDSSVYLTSGNSLKMVGTAANTQTLTGPWFPIDGNGLAYVVSGVVQSTNNTSLLTIKLEIYAGDQTTLTTTIYLYNNVIVPTANTWLTPSKEFTTTSSYNWARFIVTRASGTTASVYIDRLEVKKLGPRWGRYKDPGSGQTIVAGATTQITFASSAYANLVTTSSSDVTVYRAGVYLLYFRTQIADLDPGDTIDVFFKVTDPILGAVSQGSAMYVASSGGLISLVMTSVYRHAGTTGGGSPIGVYIRNNSGAASLFVSPIPSAPFNNAITAVTAWSGIWLGIG